MPQLLINKICQQQKYKQQTTKYQIMYDSLYWNLLLPKTWLLLTKFIFLFILFFFILAKVECDSSKGVNMAAVSQQVLLFCGITPKQFFGFSSDTTASNTGAKVIVSDILEKHQVWFMHRCHSI